MALDQLLAYYWSWLGGRLACAPPRRSATWLESRRVRRRVHAPDLRPRPRQGPLASHKRRWATLSGVRHERRDRSYRTRQSDRRAEPLLLWWRPQNRHHKHSSLSCLQSIQHRRTSRSRHSARTDPLARRLGSRYTSPHSLPDFSVNSPAPVNVASSPPIVSRVPVFLANSHLCALPRADVSIFATSVPATS